MPVESLDVDGIRWVEWDEAVEHEHDVEALSLLPLHDGPLEETFRLVGGVDSEDLVDDAGHVAGRAVRTVPPSRPGSAYKPRGRPSARRCSESR